MGVALVGIAGVRLLLHVFRSDWIAPTVSITPGTTPRAAIGSAWSTGQFGYLDAAGREYSVFQGYCQTSGEALKRCMADEGFVARYHKFYPSSDFWVFQWIETAVFLGLAVALVAAAYGMLRRRLV